MITTDRFVAGALVERVACGCEDYETGTLRCNAHDSSRHSHECRDCGASISCAGEEGQYGCLRWAGGNDGCQECPVA